MKGPSVKGCEESPRSLKELPKSKQVTTNSLGDPVVNPKVLVREQRKEPLEVPDYVTRF